MARNILRRKSSFSALFGIAFACTVCADAVYTVDGTTLTVDVPSGELQTLDAAKVTSEVSVIRKTGAGWLQGSDIGEWSGTFEIDGGVYYFAASNNCGKAYGCDLNINDGGAAVISGEAKQRTYLKDVTVSGAGVSDDSQSSIAKLVSAKIQSPKECSFYVNSFAINNDAKITAGGRINFKSANGFDLKKNKLLLAGGQVQLVGTMKNGGILEVSGTLISEAYLGKLVLQAPDETSGENDCILRIVRNGSSKGTLNLKGDDEANGWKLVCIGGQIQGNLANWPTWTGSPTWDGPMEITDESLICNFTGGYGVSNTVYNIKFPVSGSGTLTGGPGWLNLHSADNTYSGSVSFIGRTPDNIKPAGNGGPILAGGGGIGLWNNADCFSSASSVTLGLSAGLKIMDMSHPNIPVITFLGDEDQLFSGGPDGSTEDTRGGGRALMTGIVKKGNATLTIANAAEVKSVDLQEGTISLGYKRFAPQSKAGLTHDSFYYLCDDGKEAKFEQYLWCAINDPLDTIIDEQYKNPETGISDIVINDVLKHFLVYPRNQETGPEAILNGWNNPAIEYGGYSYRRTAGQIYRGYIWNRTRETKKWQFNVSMDTRVIIKIGNQWAWNNSSAFGLASNGYERSMDNFFYCDLNPGATPILIYAISWYQQSKTSPTGTGAMGLSADMNAVVGETNLANFVKLDDSGTGYMWTIDKDITDEDLLLATPVFDNLKMAPGTTFDLTGNNFIVGDLGGMGTVNASGGSLNITNCWTVAVDNLLDPATGLPTGNKLSVTDGTLRFAPGSTITAADHVVIRGEAGSRFVIAEATAIDGVPEVVEEYKRRLKFFIERNDANTGDNFVMELKGGFTVIVR